MNIMKSNLRASFPFLYENLARFKRQILILELKRKYPMVKIFSSSSGYFSQEGQDRIVHDHFFKGRPIGFFCDVGANHPVKYNNTKFFEDLGWKGLVFEPLPNMKELWNIERKALLFPFAASDVEGELVFSIVSDSEKHGDMLSFVKETKDSKYIFDTKEILVKTRPLKSVLQENGITSIDYMSIDVEGHELNVLKGIDFNAVRINVLTIENNPVGNYINGNDEIRRLMLNKNYIFWGRIVGLDDIYVHKKYIKEMQLDSSE